jgi:hypothetical protein
MKQVWKGLIAAGAVLTSAQLPAQSYKPLTVGIAAGAAIPVGTLSDDWSSGYNVTGLLALRSLGSPVGLRFEGMYNHFGGKDDAGNPPAVKIWAGTANLVYHLPGTGITPYLIGGAGFYGVNRDIEGFESENKLGLNGGIGAAFPLSGFNTFVEARLHHVFTDRVMPGGNSTQFIPVTFGITF